MDDMPSTNTSEKEITELFLLSFHLKSGGCKPLKMTTGVNCYCYGVNIYFFI